MSNPIYLPKDFNETVEFKTAFEVMSRPDTSVFITGDAGTGKSTLLQYFRDRFDGDIAVLAPTGVAAVNVGGQTIHSFFQFPLGVIGRGNVRRAKRIAEIVSRLDAIVIDEVSMVRADMMDAIDVSLQLHLNDLRPFGGMKMIFIGDIAQLPPVVRDEDKKVLEDIGYESEFFFDSKVIRYLGDSLHRIRLTQAFRQRDEKFLGILNRMRSDMLEVSDLAMLNRRAIPLPDGGSPVIHLTSTNKAADKVNADHLARLTGKVFRSQAIVEGDFDITAAPTDVTLELKVGAQVMFVRNDTGGQFVNGTVGTVKWFSKKDELLVVDVDGVDVSVSRTRWERKQYSYNSGLERVDEESIGSFDQFPLRLAWAITIHKSQGRTYDRVLVDLGWGAFAHGQTYVALSRCRSLDGVYLARRLKDRDIIVDKRAVDFMESSPLPLAPAVPADIADMMKPRQKSANGHKQLTDEERRALDEVQREKDKMGF